MAYRARRIIGEMPVERYQADDQWIDEKLCYLDHRERSSVCKAYTKAFLEAASKEPIEYKKSNAARFEANTRLRKFIDRRLSVFNRR